MAKFGCPPRFIVMVRQVHDGMQARVQNGVEFSEHFEVTNVVKHGANTVLSCSWMRFRTVTLDFQSGTALMAIYST